MRSKRIFYVQLILITLSAIALFVSTPFAQDYQPTAEEQLMLELINRARANPAAEGIRLAEHPDQNIQFAYQFFNLDPNSLKTDFASYPPRPPLAMNAQLSAAAMRHSADMRDNNFQGHDGTDGADLGQRIDDSGYTWRGIAENVYAYGESVEHAHAGFVADWGVPSLGHRRNTLEFDREPLYMEIGISILPTFEPFQAKRIQEEREARSPGVSLAQTPAVGPLVVTIDFAATFDETPQALGAAFDDINGNEFYDIDEGLRDIAIKVVETGATVTTYLSGGYSIPIAQPGTYTLEASGPGFAQPMQKTITIGNDNVKVDFIPVGITNVDHWMMH